MNEEVLKYLNETTPLILDEILKSLSPCVIGDSYRCDESEIPVGSSKFCGNPDVPENFTWPMTKDGPCWFIGQLSLNELSKFDIGLVLPKEGLLSFFYHDEGGAAGNESKVYSFSADSLVRTEAIKDTRWGSDFHDRYFYPRALSLSQGYSLPDAESLSPELLNEYGNLDDVIDEFMDIFCSGTHQFFGIPQYLWSKPRLDTMLASFGQMHDRIRYFIDRKKLENNEFEEFQVIYDCT